MENEKLKVIVADDHPIFRNGMAATLKRMKFIVEVSLASNGEEVVSLIENQQYDLVFMDIGMKPMNGIEATEIIKKKRPDVQVIALSMYDDAKHVIDMFEKGASGYLLKNVDYAEIELAIKTVRNGDKYFSKEASAVLLDHIGKEHSAKVQPQTTSTFHKQRVREIIFLISNEFTSAEIGNAISLASRTIDDYRKEILSVTRSHNTAGIVKYAIANNIDQDLDLKKKFKNALSQKQISE